MSEEEKKDFDLTNLPKEAQDSEIEADDFKLVNIDKKVHEQKFETKPTTFFKDSLKRFAKNKSSVVAAGILGFLLLCSIIIPFVDQADITTSHTEIHYLEPKLFNAGTGWWDGTKKYNNIPVDVSKMPNATTEEEKQENWWPNPSRYEQAAISKKSFTDEEYTNEQSEFGRAGYLQVGYYGEIEDTQENSDFYTHPLSVPFDATQDHWLEEFIVYDENDLKEAEGNQYTIPNNYQLGESRIVFAFYDGDGNFIEIPLTEYKTKHNIQIGDMVNISTIVKDYMTNLGKPQTSFNDVRFSIQVKNDLKHKNTCILLKGCTFRTSAEVGTFRDEFLAPCFDDPTQCIVQPKQIMSITGANVDNFAYWTSNGVKKIYMSKIVKCSFVYDSYEAMLGDKKWNQFSKIELDQYVDNGWLDFYIAINKDDGKWKATVKDFEIKSNKCPVVSIDPWVDPNSPTRPTEDDVTYDCVITYYKYYGYDTMPKYMFGTDKSGRDMLKYVSEGLRTSLLLGICTFAVCFLFGLLWGSICGYFGGAVDLVMERFTDILSGVPWIVVMTLVIINLGSNFITFALALCLTGWIGTAATTRTQFYRFRGREYVLASRTLGASDARLIARHILPNAMGTIITSSILMIPSVIFSEATISYLGLGLRDLSSLGVILSNNQKELANGNAFLMIFPSIVIALLMISFNLFGNGLRDAINPSLKGEEQ